VEQLESDRQGLASQVAQLGSDKQRVEAELERVAADKRGLESQVERLESDKQGLASQVAQLESDKQRVEAELERVAFDNRGLESQVERLESDKQGLASQVAQLESDKQRVEAELERVAADNRGLKSQVEQLSADRQALEADVARLLTDQAALTEEKRVLSTDLQQALHQIDSFRQDLEAQRHAFAALQNAFVALQNVKESLELDRDSLTEELRKVGRFSHERSAILASLRSRAWIRLGLGLHALQPFDLDDTRFIDEPKSDGSVTWIEQPGGHVQHLSSGKRWQLRVSSGNSARLLVARGDERLLRIDIARAGTKAQWDIQLDQDHLQLEAGAKYRLSFRVRSDAARAMEFGVAQAHEPWDNLGLYQRMAVTPDWATFEQEITPTADDSNGRVHFDLGRYPVSLELADVRFVPVDLESTQSERSRAIPS
jgi:outer membrane murein-binding lipoprotein Lpp